MRWKLKNVKPGLTGEARQTVTENDTAQRFIIDQQAFIARAEAKGA